MFFDFLVYNKFKKKKWTKLSLEQRLMYCQKLEHIEAKRLKRQEYQIVIKDISNLSLWGKCIKSENQLLIDDNLITEPHNRFNLMHTIFHEGRHAYQFYCIDKKKKHSIFSKEYWWNKSLEGYISYNDYKDTKSFYSMQSVELDANKYALKRLKSFKFRFKNDKQYHDDLVDYENKIEEKEKRAIKDLGIFYKLKVAWENHKLQKKYKNKNKI